MTLYWDGRWAFGDWIKGFENMSGYKTYSMQIAKGESPITVVIKPNDDNWFNISHVDPKSHDIINEVRNQIAKGLHKDISLGHLLVKMFSNEDNQSAPTQS